VIARAALATLAVLVIAWTGVLLRDWRLGHGASLPLFSPGLPPAQAARDVERLKDAELLNPDTRWRLARAKFYILLGDMDAAARTAEDLLRTEPDNLDAWGVVYRATRESDPRRSARAAAEIERLNPIASR
jgi:hypothetical protein